MSDREPTQPDPSEKADIAPTTSLPAQAEALPKETQVMLSAFAGYFRSSSGPDPETARVMAEAEMHEESCKLEAYGKSLQIRDLQNARDHEFRTKKLIHEVAKSYVITALAAAGVIGGLYLIIVLKNSNVGNPLLVASFLTLGVKIPGSKDKE